MIRHTIHAAILFSLITFFQLVSLSAVQAAPGDFLLQWGAQQHFQDPQAIARDQSGNIYVTDLGPNSSVQVFNSAGKRLYKWGSYGSGDGQFAYPLGIAVDRNSNVYVSELVNNRVQVFDRAGNFLRKWGSFGTGDGQFDYPFGIAVDGFDNVYVADANNNRIQVFDSAGNILRKWGSSGTGDGQFNYPDGLAVDGSGNVYVADSGNYRVQVFDSAGNFFRKWGSYGEADGQFTAPNAITLDGNGKVYVVDANNSRVEVFDSTGTFQWKWGSFGEENGQFNGPLGIVVGTSGDVFVADANNGRVQIFSGAGVFLRKWWSYGAGDGEFNAIYGTAIDANGKVYVVDSGNDRIQVFDRAGNFLRKWGGYGVGDGQFDYPIGIAIDGMGNVYVADTMNSRIEVFDSAGNFQSKWGGSGSDLLYMPTGVAIDGSNNVYVTDGGDSFSNWVKVFDSTGNLLRKWGSDEHMLYAGGIALDANSNVYVTDPGNMRIVVYDSQGKFLRYMGEGEVNYPRDIAVDVSGNVFVTYPGNNAISVFDGKGVLLAKWGSYGDANGLFSGPWGVAVDRSVAKVYVADTGNNRVQVFAGYGKPPLPTPWVTQDIGTVGLAGSAGYQNGTFSLSGSGADIWGTSDSFRYIYQPMTGDGQIIARVASLQSTNAWAKVGVMIRETLVANSKHALMALTPWNGAAFQRRLTAGAYSLHTGRLGVKAPYWVKLVRSGNRFSGYVSSNGVNWVLVGNDTINMTGTVYVGLAVASHNNAALCATTLNGVGVTGAVQLTSLWATSDVGNIGLTGSVAYQNGTFSMSGSGADIWGTADAFRYVYHSLTGDGQITARVGSLQNTNAWAKGGVMIRESLAANSRNAMMAITPSNGANFQRRLTSGGTSVNTAGSRVTAPYWVRLVRSRNTFSGYVSSNGVNWSLVGSDTITMTGSVFIGLAVTSHNNAALCTTTLDSVQ